MDQTEPIEITNGTLVLDEPTLNAAHIKNKARIVVRENSILILPAEPESRPGADIIAETFGSFQLPPEVARYLAEDKEIEIDQDFARVSSLLVYQPTDVSPTT